MAKRTGADPGTVKTSLPCRPQIERIQHHVFGVCTPVFTHTAKAKLSSTCMYGSKCAGSHMNLGFIKFTKKKRKVNKHIEAQLQTARATLTGLTPFYSRGKRYLQLWSTHALFVEVNICENWSSVQLLINKEINTCFRTNVFFSNQKNNIETQIKNLCSAYTAGKWMHKSVSNFSV